MEQRGATKWLSDDRDGKVVAPEDGEWGEAALDWLGSVP